LLQGVFFLLRTSISTNFHMAMYDIVWLCIVRCMKHWVPMGSLKPFHPIGVNKLEPQTCDSGRAHQNVRKDDLLPQKNYKSAIISYKSAIINIKQRVSESLSVMDVMVLSDPTAQTPLPLRLASGRRCLLSVILPASQHRSCAEKPLLFVPSFLLKILSGFYFCF
jgi:hypothetical protein